jgi:hypothetical protein
MLIGVLFSVVAIGALLLVNAPADQGPPLPIQSATSEQLAVQGIALHKPTEVPVITRSAAIELAGTRYLTAAVREVFLAEFDDIHAVPNIHLLCWGISLVPPASEMQTEGPLPGVKRSPARYLILFFDARTGAFVEGISSG